MLPSRRVARNTLPSPPAQASKQLPSYLRRQAARGWFDRTRAPLPALPPTMDASMALWSDPDVLFRHDMDTCSIPAPKLVALGPEASAGWGWGQGAAVGMRCRQRRCQRRGAWQACKCHSQHACVNPPRSCAPAAFWTRG